MSVLSYEASNSSHTHSDVMLFTYCHLEVFWWPTVLTGEMDSIVSELSGCGRGMLFLVSGQRVLMTTAQLEWAVTWSPRGQADNQRWREWAVTWSPRGQADNQRWREWVLRQYIMRISKAMPMREPKCARSFSVQFISFSFLSCHEGSHSKQERYISH